MQRSEILVHLGERSYPIVVTSGELEQAAPFAKSRSAASQALVICDANTERPYAQRLAGGLEELGIRTSIAVLEAGEASKSLESARLAWDRLTEMAADRRTLVIAVGGGVVGDLAGFVAATYARGVPFVQVPTSLLAQVDSSVGGKVGINHQMGDRRVIKNIIGAFHQPVGVFVDVATLESLPLAELRAGLAEVVKYGVILDPELFASLESSAGAILDRDPEALGAVVARSCRLKADVVEVDERELTDRRAILNYGHTFAHAIEAVSRAFRHGEAVAIGMVAASQLAERVVGLDRAVTERQAQLLERFGLPTRAAGIDPAALLDAMRHDKKARSGRLRFVLPRGIGSVEIVPDVPLAAVQGVLEQLTG